MTSGWSLFVVLVTILNILGCVWLLRWTAKPKTPGEKKVALTGLLFGADLADSCFLFHDDGKAFVDTEDLSLKLPSGGGIVGALRERRGPIPIVDLVDSRLQERPGAGNRDAAGDLDVLCGRLRRNSTASPPITQWRAGGGRTR